MAELIKIYPENPNEKQIRKVVDCLKSGCVIIYPTDTVYGLGCDLKNSKAVEKLARIKGVKADKANFSLICYDLSHISDYAKIGNPTFKLMKRLCQDLLRLFLRQVATSQKCLMEKRRKLG